MLGWDFRRRGCCFFVLSCFILRAFLPASYFAFFYEKNIKLCENRLWPSEMLLLVCSLLFPATLACSSSQDVCTTYFFSSIIIITRPKPAHGRQDLAESWGQNTDQVGTLSGVLNVSLRASGAQLGYEKRERWIGKYCQNKPNKQSGSYLCLLDIPLTSLGGQ